MSRIICNPNKRKSNSFVKKSFETKKYKSKLKILLPILACLFVVATILIPLKKFSPIIDKVKIRSDVSQEVSKQVNYQQSLGMATKLYKEAKIVDNTLETRMTDGSTITYTIDTSLQNTVQKYMIEKSVPYGIFVAIEPKSGKVLALTSYSFYDPKWSQDSYFRLYPMASLFKIITASAALEMKKVEPGTNFSYRGYSYSENPRYWSVAPGKTGQQMPLSLAMGKSINPVFGRLASDVVGKENIMLYANRFGFNQDLFPGTEVTPSRAAVPQNEYELRLMGAGLGREVKISPFHAAMMVAAVANQGAMMAPILAYEIRDRNKRELHVEKPRELRKLVSVETAGKLSEMLLSTVTSGTSRKAFHDRRGRPKLESIQICAKTGSINGTDPAGSYSWFAAFAPKENPQIAIVALIINRDRWKIKASHLGEQALEYFFQKDKEDRFSGVRP